MQWSGTTQEQRRARLRAGVRKFALMPTKMVDGRWVWLEHYWVALHVGMNANAWYVRAKDREDCLPYRPKGPPPPSR